MCQDTLCAPLWDSQKNVFVGIFTVTDFIDLLYYYSYVIQKDVTLLNNESIESIIYFLRNQQVQQQHQAASSSSAVAAPTSDDATTSTSTATTTTATTNVTTNYHNMISFQLLHPFYGASTNCTLYNACVQLLTSKPVQHFLPILFVDDMRILACITYTTILEFLVTHFREQRRLFDDSIIDLHIGTYGDDVIRITTHDTLQTAIRLMTLHQLSAIPVVDVQPPHKVIAMYSHSDITFLTRAVDAEDAVRNLNLTMYDILNASNPLPTSTTTPQGVVPSPTVAPPITTLGTPPISTTTTTAATSTTTTPPLTTATTATTTTTTATTTTPDALRTCLPNHTLQYIFESFAIQRFNRLCIVHEETESIIGIVSAKDLVQYFLSDTIH